MSITYSEFKKNTLGKGYDVDGAYGNQCWDYAMYYFKQLGYPVFNCTTSGYVKDIYENRKTSGILKYFDEVEVMQAGDVAIFKVSNTAPYSHIAIFDSDAGNGYGNFLGQNQPESHVTIAKLPYSDTYTYALRPKCFAGKKTTSTETKKTTATTDITYSSFKKSVLGKGYDVDGAYGKQSWDFAMYYFKQLGYPVFNCTTSGYVKDIYENRKTSGILKYFDEVEVMQAGDVAIFKESNTAPHSHIAIFDSDAGNGYGYFLGQNQPESHVTIAKLPYSDTYKYALRPKRFA